MAVPPPIPIPEHKARLRAELRARRHAFVAAMGTAGRQAAETKLTERVLGHLGEASRVAAYVAVGDEIDPAALVEALAARGAAIALPFVARRSAPMRFLRWAPGAALHAGPLGLLQPPADAPELVPDHILAPLLGFDRGGGRIGQGAAFYDRAFAALPLARRIGLAWSVQEEDRLPMEVWDMRLQAIATEREWIAC